MADEKGSLKANDFGLYNMSGNVWEWMHDWFSPTYTRKQQGHSRPSRPGEERQPNHPWRRTFLCHQLLLQSLPCICPHLQHSRFIDLSHRLSMCTVTNLLRLIYRNTSFTLRIKFPANPTHGPITSSGRAMSPSVKNDL